MSQSTRSSRWTPSPKWAARCGFALVALALCVGSWQLSGCGPGLDPPAQGRAAGGADHMDAGSNFGNSADLTDPDDAQEVVDPGADGSTVADDAGVAEDAGR